MTGAAQVIDTNKAIKMSKNENLYDRLGVLNNARPSEIEAAFKKMSGALNPDRVRGEFKEDAREALEAVNDAYNILSEPRLRSGYDTQLNAQAKIDQRLEELDSILGGSNASIFRSAETKSGSEIIEEMRRAELKGIDPAAKVVASIELITDMLKRGVDCLFAIQPLKQAISGALGNDKDAITNSEFLKDALKSLLSYHYVCFDTSPTLEQGTKMLKFLSELKKESGLDFPENALKQLGSKVLEFVKHQLKFSLDESGERAKEVLSAITYADELGLKVSDELARDRS